MFVPLMKRIFRSTAFLVLITAAALMINAAGCANIIPPTGGLRDSLPPVLMDAVPKDSMLNFKGNKIVLTFDEYVQLDNNINENLVVSPMPDNPPLIENKLKTVTVKLKDSLKPNTTYSINFGNGIKDVNENNVFRNFTYVFSTGDKLAEGTLSGKVTVAETGEADSTLIVVLYRNLTDTAVKKNKPDFYAKLDSGGRFKFRFLPEEKFAVYVVPNDYSKRYDDSTKTFAFYDTTVNAGEHTSSIMLYAYQQFKATEKKPGGSTSSSGSKDHVPEIKFLKVNTNLDNNEQDLLSNLYITFNKEVTIFDSANAVQFTDTLFKPVTGYTFQRDTGLRNFVFRYKWPEHEPFELILNKDAFTDSAGLKLLHNDTLSFSTKREGQYGSIRLHFNNLDMSRNPVLLLLQDSKIVKSVPLISNDWYQKLFKPGEYRIRILYDDNKNGIWDPGNLDTRLQPEKVQNIPRKLTIKANWDNEVDINL